MKTRLAILNHTRTALLAKAETLTNDMNSADESSVTYNKAQVLLQEAASAVQVGIEKSLTVLCTKALKDVFYDKDISFGVSFVPQKNTTNVDMWIEENGIRYDPLESRGHGLADLLTFALRVSILVLQPQLRRVLIMDEPFTRISAEYRERAIAFVKEVSKETGIQIILVTHIPELASDADKVFTVKLVDGISKVA